VVEGDVEWSLKELVLEGSENDIFHLDLENVYQASAVSETAIVTGNFDWVCRLASKKGDKT
jgi:hypothetical protein